MVAGPFKNEVTWLPVSQNQIHILGIHFKVLSQSVKLVFEVAFIVLNTNQHTNHRHLVPLQIATTVNIYSKDANTLWVCITNRGHCIFLSPKYIFNYEPFSNILVSRKSSCSEVWDPKEKEKHTVKQFISTHKANCISNKIHYIYESHEGILSKQHSYAERMFH